MLRRLVKWLPKTTRIKMDFYRQDLSDSKGIPLMIRLKMWRKGFKARNYYYLDIRKKGSKYFVSDLFNEMTHPKNGKNSSLIDNKLYLPYCLKDYPEKTPNYNFLVDNGKIIELSGDHNVYDLSYDSFIHMFPMKKRQVGKIIGKEGGSGIYFLERDKKDQLLINNSPHSMKKAYEFISKLNDLVIMDRIEPHPYSYELNPTTINTLRIITAWDDVNNEPFIVSGAQKIGKGDMFGVDNGSMGGLAAELDTDNGIIKKVAVRKEREVKFVDNHPDTNVRITGRRVPNYDGVRKELLEICRDLNFLKFIGWDILITEDSFKVIEMNSNPDTWAIQMFRELLRDEKTMGFYSRFVNKKNRKYFMR